MSGVFGIETIDDKMKAKNYLLIIISILFLTDLAILLNVPFLRQIQGFLFLTLLPGLLILQILKLNKQSTIKTILYSAGLSIAFLMFTGLFINTLYPFIGFSKPISILPLVTTINIALLILCVLSYKINKDFINPISVNIKDIISPPTLFLCLIPFLAIFGTYLMNFYQNNIFILILIVVIGLVTLLIGFDKFIPEKLYPLAVFIIAISLLYHRSLISMYVSGYDIQGEYYLCNLVKTNGIWDPTMGGSNLNAMLSLTMLAPIYSIILNMEITWVFKIIYPLLFSLVPLGLYRVFQKQTDDKIAFLACFFFMSLATSFAEMPTLARQEIAELFLVLLVLLMIGTNMDKIKRSFLFIVFGISLVVSHYGLSYIYMFCLISAWLILVLTENPNMQELKCRFLSKFGRWKEKLAGNPNFLNLKIEDRTIHSTFVLLFIVFTLTWYMYISSSSAFVTIVYIGDHIASSIFTDFLNPGAAEGLYLLMSQPKSGLLHEVNRVINYLNQLFIVIGCIVLLKRREREFKRDYSAFSVINLGILFASIAVPFFASSLNMVRVYQITLIFLAPFCVIGGITVLRVIGKIVRMSWTDKRVRSSLKILSVYFVIFLLYQTGVVLYVAEGQSSSVSLNSTAEGYRYNDREVLGAMWLNDVKGRSSIYADEPRWLLLYSRLGPEQLDMFTVDNINKTREDSYIYFGTRNAMERDVRLRHKTGVSSVFEYINLEHVVDNRSKIYANGGSEIYK